MRLPMQVNTCIVSRSSGTVNMNYIIKIAEPLSNMIPNCKPI